MAIKRKTHLNLSGSHHTLDSDNAFVGGTVFVTGSVSASIGKFQYLTGSLSGTLAGLPFIVGDVATMGTIQYRPSTGQWEITGSGGGGSPGGANTQIQFNENGTTLQGDSQLTFNTASIGSLTPYTLSAPTGSLKVLSGSNADSAFANELGGPLLLINSNVVVTESVVIFDGTSPGYGGGTKYSNGASINVNSGSVLDTGNTFDIIPNQSGDGHIDIVYNDIYQNSINLRPLYVSMSTTGNSGVLLSGSLLISQFFGGTVGKLDFNILAALSSPGEAYASWAFSVTAMSSSNNIFDVFSVTELDSSYSGSLASTWDVNVNSNGDIYCTGSAGDTVRWYAQATKKMVLTATATPFIAY